MPNKRSIGKLEAKIARNYVHQHLTTRHRNNNPEEVKETVFVGSLEEMQQTVLAELKQKRTGEIPEYPRGLVCFDSNDNGYFNKVTVLDEAEK